jgi:peptidoglycan/xylan/chitin deacetylase (PgdA/CDA1 family)
MSALLAVLLALPPVVMYHRVDASAPSDAISQRLTISPAQFAGELHAIARLGLHSIGISDLAQAAAQGRPPQSAVLLTFDDGYSDQFRYAFPALQHYGARAVFFINTGTIGTPGHMTWPEVEAMAKAGMSIECHGVDHVDLSSLSLGAQTHQINGCIQTLQAHVPGAVLAFAYPSGGFNPSTIAVERRAGVLFGFTTDPRFQRDARSPYQIVRIRAVSGMNDAYFAAALQRSPAYVQRAAPPTAAPAKQSF